MTQSFIDTEEDSGIYQNMCEERVNMNDILGPLPNIPNNNNSTTSSATAAQESDKNWSRRMSGMSGIYEEIIDPSSNSSR
jgi:hypothetical protein